MLTIYGDGRSGNCYKLQLLASHLDLDYAWVEIDIMAGGTQTADFRAMNPNAKIPLLKLDDGAYLAESNAILNYLADGTALLPQDRLARARVLEWQCFEQYSHEPNIAVARFIQLYQHMPEERRAEYAAKQRGGHLALGVMEQHLTEHDYFVRNRVTIADISLYAYTHVAHEGGFQLGNYPAIRAWLQRIASHPRHLPMER